MATERIILLKLLTDLKQPVQSFAELERRIKTVKDVLKNTPNEGTKAFDQLAKTIAGELNISIDKAKAKINEFTKTATTEVQRGNDALKDYRKTLNSLSGSDKGVKDILAAFKALNTSASSFTSLDKKIKTLAQGLKKVPEVGTAEFDRLAQKISQELGISLDQARNKLTQFGTSATKEVRRGNQELKEFNRTLRTVEPAAGSINALRQQVRSLANEVDNLDTETEEFTNKNNELRRMNQRLIEIEQTTLRGGRNVGNYNTAFKGLARTLTGIAGAFGVGFGIAGSTRLVRDAIGIFREFNQEIATLRAVSGASDEEIKILEADAKKLGETTQFTAVQVAQLKVNLARLGFNPKEINEATESILNLSIATQEDLATSAKIVGQTVRAYSLEATDAGRVTDALTTAFNTSALQLNTYGEAYKLFAPVAKTLNISFEEATAAIGLFADQGLEGTIATTALSTGFQRLTDKTSKASKVAAQLGIEVFNQKGEFVGLAELLKNVENATEGMTQQNQLATLSQIFGARATKNFAALLNSQREVMTENGTEILRGGAALEQYTKQLEDSAGAAKATADVVGNTLNQDILKLRSAIEGAAIQFVEMNQGGLREFIQFLTRAVPVLAENVGLILRVTAVLALYIAQAKLAGKTTALVALAQKGFSTASALLAGRISLVTVATKAYNKALAANPIGLAVTAIVALIFAFQELYNRSEAFREFIDGIVNGFKNFVKETGLAKSASELFSKVMSGLRKVFTATLAIVKGLVLGIIDFFKESKLGQLIIKNITTSFEIMGKVIKTVVNVLKLIGTAIATFAKENRILNTIVTKLGEAFEVAGTAILTFLDLISNTNAFIAGLRAEVKETLQDLERFFEVLIINAKIAAKQVEKLNPFGKTTEQLDEEIKKLRARRAVIGLEGRKFGEAFTEAYNAALALENEIEVKANVTDVETDPDNPDATGGTVNLETGFNEGDAEKQLTYLETLLKKQRELAEAIKNAIAENKPYAEQLEEFKKVTAELTEINEEYDKAIGKIKDTTKDYVDGSLKDYDTQISKLQASLKLVNIGSQEYTNISNQIIILDNKKASELDNLATRTDEYRQSLIDLNNQIRTGDAELGVTQAALTQLQNLTNAGEEGANQIKQIQEQLNKDLQQIERQRLNSTRDALLSEIEILNAAQEQELSEAEGNEQKKEDIRRKYRRIRGEAELDLLQNQKELLDLDFKQFEANEKKKTDTAKKEADKRKQIQDAAFDVANALNQAVFEILDNRQQQELDRQTAALDAEEERALRSADIVGATEQQKEEIRRRFEAEREAIEREAARKAKRNAIIGATINTALAVTKALATLPPPASFITAGLTAALGAIQVATISSQQFALGGLFDNQVRSGGAKFARGAYLNKGAYHSSGGMPIINPHTGQKVAEIEKDEGIINRRSMMSKDVLKMEGTPYEIASMINSYKGYGNAYPSRGGSKRRAMTRGQKKFKYKHGGRYGVNNRVMKLASGAVFSSDIQNAAIQVNSEDRMQQRLTASLIEEVRQLRKSNEKAISQIPSTADELKKANQLVVDEENAS